MTLSIVRRFNAAKLRHYTRQVLSDYVSPAPRVEIAQSPTPFGAFDMRILRRPAGFRIEVSDVAFSSGVQRRSVRNYAAVWAYWLHRADPAVQGIVCDTSDGNWPG